MSKKKMYIFDYVSPVTNQYHDGGAVLIVCDEFGFIEAWNKEYPEFPDTLVGAEYTALDMPVGTPDFIKVFEDSGCC